MTPVIPIRRTAFAAGWRRPKRRRSEITDINEYRIRKAMLAERYPKPEPPRAA